MSTSTTTHWYFIENNAAQGPFTLTQMRTGTTQGKIKPETLVCPAGDQTWSPAKNWPTLFPPKPPVSTAAPPPLPNPGSKASPVTTYFTAPVPLATAVSTAGDRQMFSIVHWVFNGILAALFLGRVIYYFHDKQFNLLTFESFVFNNGFSWPILLPQLALSLSLAWFLQPRVKWMLIGVLVVGIFSFVGSFALSFEAFRQRRALPN